ncbi:MAG TPA: hypothetical protein VFW84_14910 [Aquabacterium sp.]|uniref:hypothetical protein n=1 Tax=Aquabacterium sp. TaxID=1872578 RepID=UPI002E3386CD|nr:hypothetical protein [Aquabacterium sp.]HEX5374015.1 hypothetical protein [Aquabacterium sp.]
MTYKIKLKQGSDFRVAVTLLMLSSVMPARAETPLSLSVSETLTYDSNILRDNQRKRRDVVSSTGVQIGFDKSYGRQTYTATAAAQVQRYKNSKEYDNDGYDISLGFSTEIGKDGSLQIQHDRSQSLQDFGDQGRVRDKIVIDSNSTTVSGRYGLYGRWSLTGSFDQNDVAYTEPYDYQNKSSRGVRVGLRYNPSDLLYFDGGLKRTVSDYPKYPLFSGLTEGDRVKRLDLDLRSGWTVTGFSNLTAQVSWTQEKHETLDARFVDDDRRDFNGLTGRLNWNFSPAGKTSYAVALDRDTNNAGGSSGLFSSYAQNRLTTGLVLNATWRPTAKISVVGGFNVRWFEEEQRDLDGAAPTQSLKGNYQSLSLKLNYSPTRNLGFTCSLMAYDRTETVFANAYSGETASCSASFSID